MKTRGPNGLLKGPGSPHFDHVIYPIDARQTRRFFPPFRSQTIVDPPIRAEVTCSFQFLSTPQSHDRFSTSCLSKLHPKNQNPPSPKKKTRPASRHPSTNKKGLPRR